MLQENISRREALALMFGAAATAAIGAEAKPAVAAGMTESGLSVVKFDAPTLLRGVSNAGSEFVIPTPKGINPDNGEMNNVLINEAPRKTWFHPKGQKEGVWAYDNHFAYDGDGQLLDEMTGEGLMGFRQLAKGSCRFILGMGISEEFKGKDLRGLRGENPTIWIKTHPYTEFRFWNPDNGQPIVANGEQVCGTASDGGDIGFLLGNKAGRILAETVIVEDPRHETFIRKGSIEDFDMNHVDLRNHVHVHTSTCGC